MNEIEFIEDQIYGLRKQLKTHKLYAHLKTLDDVKVFAENHVFAVWDFMSLLKALQRDLTCVEIPWMPSENTVTARFINEIVHGEETDLNENGVAKSHFEMYLDSMNQMGASTKEISRFIDGIQNGKSVNEALKKMDLPQGVKDFVLFSFKIIETKKTHLIASAFTFGREDLIPDIFLQILKGSMGTHNNYSSFVYYLERHIELDGDEHGPLSLKMIQELCEENAIKWEETLSVAKESLQMRINLWDSICESIKENKLNCQAVLN